ncbi:MAG: hypothetical protein NTZ07_01500 [Candidatus Woesebacteria bacterium]|nr:hypothetical protein [Candidatus Woesebacteria bacterium]
MPNYKYFSKDLGKWINADPEVWQWEVTYEDGGILKQFGDDGIFHQFAEIDQSQLVMFKMISPQYSQTYALLLSDPSMKLVHFYRNTILNAGTSEEKHIRLYCFGYEKRVGSKVQKVLMAITPANELIVTEDPNLVTI